jgi:hypothetical protein
MHVACHRTALTGLLVTPVRSQFALERRRQGLPPYSRLLCSTTSEVCGRLRTGRRDSGNPRTYDRAGDLLSDRSQRSVVTLLPDFTYAPSVTGSVTMHTAALQLIHVIAARVIVPVLTGLARRTPAQLRSGLSSPSRI